MPAEKKQGSRQAAKLAKKTLFAARGVA